MIEPGDVLVKVGKLDSVFVLVESIGGLEAEDIRPGFYYQLVPVQHIGIFRVLKREAVLALFGYKGNTVPASGSSLECLSQSSTFLLQVNGNDRQTYNISLTVQVVTRGY